MDEKKMWNQAADHYQATLQEEDQAYPEALLRFLKEEEALRPGCSVADIGCGTGKYALRFAREHCDLLLLDFAHNMMKYTLENLSGYPGIAGTAVCDWSETDPAQLGWENAADLAFASMTPAIRSREDVLKLCRISRKYCFISKFISMENLLHRDVARLLDIELPDGLPDQQSPLETLQWVLDADYLPAVRFLPYHWENHYTVEQAEKALRNSRLAASLAGSDAAVRLHDVLRSLADERGLICEKVETRVIWILWDVRK